MALVLADRVKETTTTTGTGTITLAGAATGFQSFAVVGNANTTFYCIAAQTGNEWEVGIGTYTLSGTTLARTTVLSNSAGTQPTALTFSAGTKDVFVTYPSSRSIYADGTTLTATNSSILPATSGGTGQSSYAVGDILFASTTTALSKLADVATGNAIISGGIGVAPSYGKIALTTHVSGTLPIANGGTNSTATATAGGIAYGTGTAYAVTAAGTAGQVITSAGAGVPTWTTATNANTASAIVQRDASGNFSAGTITAALSGNATTATSATSATSATTATNLAGGAVGSIAYQSGVGATTFLADVATGSAVISGGVGVAPSYGKIGLTTHVSGTLPVANGGTGVTTSTGTGNTVLSTSPTFTTPLLGTPTSGVLTNCTGYTAANISGTINLTTQVTGTLPIANGGTNSTATATAGGIGYGTGTAHAYTVAGTSGQVLTSAAAGVPTWTTATSANTASAIVQRDASGNFTAGTITAALSGNATTATTATNQSGGTVNATTGAFSGVLTTPKTLINRSSGTATGIAWYNSSFTAWTDYMSLATATGCGPYGTITAPSGTLVTAWGMRSFIENVAGYGWTFESGTSSQVTPTIVAEIRSSDGAARFAGTVTAPTFSGALSGNATTATSATSATTATNLAGGSAGTVPYQSAAGTTVQLAAGTAGQFLKSNGAAAPSWSAPSSIILENSQTIAANYTIGTGNNGLSVGPVTINSGVTVTVGSGQRWLVL